MPLGVWVGMDFEVILGLFFALPAWILRCEPSVSFSRLLLLAARIPFQGEFLSLWNHKPKYSLSCMSSLGGWWEKDNPAHRVESSLCNIQRTWLLTEWTRWDMAHRGQSWPGMQRLLELISSTLQTWERYCYEFKIDLVWSSWGPCDHWSTERGGRNGKKSEGRMTGWGTCVYHLNTLEAESGITCPGSSLDRDHHALKKWGRKIEIERKIERKNKSRTMKYKSLQLCVRLNPSISKQPQ